MSRDLQVHTVGLRRDLGRRCALANLDELRVVDRVLQRLEVGRQRYGQLDLSAPRNWRKERFEERLDALVYDVAEELAAEDVERAVLHQDARNELLAWQNHQRTAISAKSARIALEEIVDSESYAEWNLSDVEAG